MPEAASPLPSLNLGFDDAGEAVAQVGDTEVRSPADLLEAAPFLLDPAYARACARLALHLTKADEMELITDPGSYRAEYEARRAAEDPDEESVPGKIRLHDYGQPDFGMLHPPRSDGATVEFCARHTVLGLPYLARLSADGRVEYTPAPLLA